MTTKNHRAATRKRLTQKPRHKLTRAELKRDRFVDTVFDWALWSRENVRTVLIGLGVLAILVLAVILYRGAQAGQASRAGQRYREVWQTYLAGNYQLAANDFRQFLESYRGTEYADDAVIYLAESYLRSGDPDAALTVLRDFEEEFDESPYHYAAATLRGAAYEAKGEPLEAVRAYERAASAARYDYERVVALMNEARMYAAHGSRDKAAEAYRKILTDHAESPAASEARVKLAELTIEPLVRRAPTTAAAAEPTEPATSTTGPSSEAGRPGAASSAEGTSGAPDGARSTPEPTRSDGAAAPTSPERSSQP